MSLVSERAPIDPTLQEAVKTLNFIPDLSYIKGLVDLLLEETDLISKYYTKSWKEINNQELRIIFTSNNNG